ncbi:MAG: AAA family ATPase [bacterium]
MMLKKIKKIKSYKSFQDFSWSSFFNNQEFHESANIFYGENGAGKSTISNILKSISQKNSFASNQIPEEICLEFEDGDYTFFKNSNDWDKLKNNGDILFFDREFVHDNIHLGNSRNTQANGQEQKSGKMIIEFDSEAIKLNESRQKAKQAKENKSEEIQNFNKAQKDTLDFLLSDEEKILFDRFKDKTKEEITNIKNELSIEKKELEKKQDYDKTTQKQVIDIQNSISEINNEKIEIYLSDYSVYQALFSFDLKEQVKIQAEKDLTEKIRQQQDFFQAGIKIREKHQNNCPFCQSESEEENIGKIIKAYNDIFDDTYKNQLKTFEKNKNILVEELENIINTEIKYKLSSVFEDLSELNQKYKIKDIYLVEEQKKYKKPVIGKIAILKKKIEDLEKPISENIEKIYNEVKSQVETLEEFFSEIYKYVESKNTLIRIFKSDNTGEKIEQRITENGQKIIESNLKINFFNEKKIDNQKQKESKEKDLKALQEEFKQLEAVQKKVNEDYEKYCSKEVFKKTLEKIEEYFGKFKFSFKLELKTEKIGKKTENPFAFKVLDNENIERDFKEGLSEGELQVLSLCFFFAFLDIQTNPQDKILVFDDPITSLDNNNLSHLVDLIEEEHKKFSQTFVFTHHRTFFKFFRKSFKTGKDDKLANEYNIIRNRKELGGSFICKSCSKKFRQKLKGFEEIIYEKAKQRTSINIEMIIVEYGQYLRYEVENYIKNDLLHWDADSRFSKAIDGIKKKIETELQIVI